LPTAETTLSHISTSCQILLEELDHADREFLLKMLTTWKERFTAHATSSKTAGVFEGQGFSLVPTSLEQVVDRSLSLTSSQLPPVSKW